MNTVSPRFCSALIGFGLLLAVGSASAQVPAAPTRVEAKISDLKVIMQKTPEFQASVSDSKKDGSRREWLELEAEFETVSDSQIGIIPELLAQVYIAVQGAGGQIQILSDSFTYVNAIDKEDNWVVVYVSPSNLARVNGEMGKFRLGDVKAVGIELLYSGRVVASAAEGLGDDWWTKTQAPRMPGLISSKGDTPFSLLWIDRHLEEKRR